MERSEFWGLGDRADSAMRRQEYGPRTEKNVTGVVVRLLESSQYGQMDAIVWSLRAAGYVFVSRSCLGWYEDVDDVELQLQCHVGSWLDMDVTEVETEEEEQILGCHWQAVNVELWQGPPDIRSYHPEIGPSGIKYTEVRGLVCCVFPNKLFVWTEIFGKVFVGYDLVKGRTSRFHPMVEVHVGLVSAFGCGLHPDDCGWYATNIRILSTKKFDTMFPSVRKLNNLKLVKVYDNCAILGEHQLVKDLHESGGSIMMTFNDYCDFKPGRMDNILDVEATYRALVVSAPAAEEYPYRAICVKAIPSLLTIQAGTSSSFRHRPESAERAEDQLLPSNPPSNFTMSPTARPGSSRSNGADSGGLFETWLNQKMGMRYGAALAAGATDFSSSDVRVTSRAQARSVGGRIDATQAPLVLAEPLSFRDEASPIFNVSSGFGNRPTTLTPQRAAKSTVGVGTTTSRAAKSTVGVGTRRNWTSHPANSERHRVLPAMVQCPWTEMEKQARASDFPPALPPPLEPVPVQNPL